MKNTVTIIVLACVTAGCIIAVWIHEANTLANARDQLQRYTRFLAPPLANLDRDTAQEYIDLTRGRGFDPASVILPDGKTFVAMQPGGDSGSVDGFLRSLGLIRGVPLSSRIVYHGQCIGDIRGVWMNKNIYAYFNASLILLLALAVVLLAERRVERLRLQKTHHETELRVRQRTAELAAVNRELEAFSYSVSHDLRAPLRHVDGFADMLSKHSGEMLDEKGRRYLKNISDAAKRMGLLIDDLLAFSRIGRAEMRRVEVDLHAVAKDVIQESQHETAGRNIIWKCHPLPVVEGDPALFRQVLVNLISNAAKYSRPRDPATIEIGCVDGDSGERTFFVRDNGVGFDMAYGDKLFGVFQRLHRAEEFEGTGIGLANVRRIILRHGGRTWAEGRLGEGATFYFSLPNGSKLADTMSEIT